MVATTEIPPTTDAGGKSMGAYFSSSTMVALLCFFCVSLDIGWSNGHNNSRAVEVWSGSSVSLPTAILFVGESGRYSDRSTKRIIQAARSNTTGQRLDRRV